MLEQHAHLGLMEGVLVLHFPLHSEIQTDRALSIWVTLTRRKSVTTAHWILKLQPASDTLSSFTLHCPKQITLTVANQSGQRGAVPPCVLRRRIRIHKNCSKGCHQIFGSFLFQSTSCLKVINARARSFGQRDVLRVQPQCCRFPLSPPGTFHIGSLCGPVSLVQMRCGSVPINQ